jgi:hypothetical protein
MKKQIEFDFEKFGQENVTAFIDGVEILTVHKFPSSYPDRYYGLDVKGMTYDRHKSKLVMVQKIKPREIWLNEYPDGFIGSAHLSKEKAINFKLSTCIATIKFIEVLDNEQ